MQIKEKNQKAFERSKKQISQIAVGTLSIVFIIIFILLCTSILSLYTYEKKLLSDNDEIQSIKEELNTTNNTIEETFQKIQLLQQRNKTILHNPTYNEAYNFIILDKTDENTYENTTYNCAYFSRDVNNNSEKQNVRCAYVEINFRTGSLPHAIVAFNTTDQGLVFFEPQTDETVHLEIGKDYWTECIVSDEDYGYGNIVDSFTLYW